MGTDIQAILESKTWTFAKTMPRNPHYWSVVKDWDDPKEFAEAVKHINEHGVTKRFGRRDYIVFYMNGWRYWTMDKNLEKVDLINRARIDESDLPQR